MQTIDKQVVEANELDGALGGRLRDQGMDAAVLVMLGGRGAGTNSGFWSRVVMAESNGVWLMELIHGLTGFKDLYSFANDADPPERDHRHLRRDVGVQSDASHRLHQERARLARRGSDLAARGRVHRLRAAAHQPGPAAASTAGRRRAHRQRLSLRHGRSAQDDRPVRGWYAVNDGQERGIASEGVIAYRVQTRNPTVQAREGNKKPIYLMTLTALQPGQSAALDNGMKLTVNDARADGFAISISKSLWGPWASVSEGRSTPGAPITAVPWGQRIALFLADPNGGVYTTGGDPQGGFGPWASVSEGRSTPGAPITAVPWGQRIALFLADPNGGVYTTGGDPQGGFGPWASVSEGGARPAGR